MSRMTLMLALVAMTLMAALAPRAAAQHPDDGSRPDTPKYSIAFQGGTLEEYCQTIRDIAGANIVTDQHAASINMPKVALEDCTVTTLLNIADRQQGAIKVSRILSDGDNLGQSVEFPSGARGRSGKAEPRAEPIWIYLVTVDMTGKVFVGDAAGPSSLTDVRLFDLNFSGGNALEYIDLIRELAPETNILAMPGVEQFPVPALHMKSVSVAAALGAIHKQEAQINNSPAVMVLKGNSYSGNPETIYTLSLGRHIEEKESKVWSVAHVIGEDADEADLLSAVQAALDLNGLEAAIRFHPETQLLMVRGSDSTLDLVNSTLLEVQSSFRGRSNASFMQSKAGFEKRLRELEKQVQQLSSP